MIPLHGIRQCFIPRDHRLFFLLLMVIFYRESPPSPVVLSHSISRNKSISPSVVPSRSASSATTTGTLIRRQGSHKDQTGGLPPTPTREVVDDKVDDAESEIPEANQTQTLQPPSQRLQHGTAAWILASRTVHAPKKPVDTQFMAYMADIRRQLETNESDAGSTGSTPPVSLIVPRDSVTSSAFSQSLSISSSPPIVEFPPTPVFKDEIPEQIMRMISTSRGIVDSS